MGSVQVTTPPTLYRQTDIVVPAIGQVAQVIEFCNRLGKTMKAFRQGTFNGRRNHDFIRVRVVLPTSREFQRGKLVTSVGLAKPSAVILVDMSQRRKDWKIQSCGRHRHALYRFVPRH